MNSDRFISPCKPPEGRTRELLVCLMEEAAEVQQRAAKALRFGVEEIQPGQPYSNLRRLLTEIGDFDAVVERIINGCEHSGPLWEVLDLARAEKHAKLDKYLQSEPTP